MGVRWRESKPAAFSMQTNAVAVMPLLGRWDNGQHRRLSDPTNPSQLFPHGHFFRSQLFCVGHLLPWTPATPGNVGTRRGTTLRRRLQQLYNMTSGVPFLLFVNSDLDLIPRHCAWHEDDFAICTSNTGRTVGQCVDGDNASTRRRHE